MSNPIPDNNISRQKQGPPQHLLKAGDFDFWSRLGYRDALIPIEPGGKAPILTKWTTHRTTVRDLRTWRAAGCGVGLRTRDFPTLDIDCDDPELVNLITDKLRALFFPHPLMVRGRKNSARCAVIFRLMAGMPPKPKRKKKFFNSETGVKCALELLGDGQQVVIDGMHPSGVPYEIMSMSGPLSWVELPVWTAEAEQMIFGKEATP